MLIPAAGSLAGPAHGGVKPAAIGGGRFAAAVSAGVNGEGLRAEPAFAGLGAQGATRLE